MTGYKNSFSGDYADAPSYPVIDPPDGNLRAFFQDESAQWRIVLAEFLHLLGLFLRHVRQAKSAWATAVLFEQIIRHLMILE
jgi:predicted secreted protein